jgi:uncharacterized protein YbjQ (UPF0145 family)
VTGFDDWSDAKDWTPEQLAYASAHELVQGRLPLRAQWRLAEQRKRAEAGDPGAFTSDLTVEEFAAIRSVGFTPVGQVLGTAVYNVGYAFGGCGYSTLYTVGAPAMILSGFEQLVEDARYAALRRMTFECEALGGDGVVGVRLAAQPFHEIGLEFLAIGTAVRADGDVRPVRPFTSDLSGQDFAKLLRAGWVPVALLQGVGASIRHDDWLQFSQGMSWMNQEMTGLTSLVEVARSRARLSLTRDAAMAGAHTVVLRDMMTRMFHRECRSTEGHDHIAEALLWGTGIVPFTTARHRDGDVPLKMLRLNR